MNLKSVTITGKEAVIDMKDSLFELAHDSKIVARAVRVYLSNQRQGTAKAKTRGEVDRTKKKFYKQKHTGNARHGARSAPIFVGGGVTHGPRGISNWTLSLSKKMRNIALQTALSLQAKENRLMIVSDLEKVGDKTKDVAKMLKDMNVKEDKVLIITESTMPALVRASRNVGSVLCTRVDRINTYEVMSAHKILATEGALHALAVRFGQAQDEEMNEAPVEKKAVRRVAKKK